MSADPWTDAAVGEEAAVYAYGVLIPSIGTTDHNAAIAANTAHARARDRARAALAGADKNPQMPVAFEIPFAVNDPASAKRLAVLCETRLVNLYASLASEVDGDDRAYFCESAQECNARAVLWGLAPAAFPGATGAGSAGPSESGQPSQAPSTPGPVSTSEVPAAPQSQVPSPVSTSPTDDGAIIQ